MQFRMPANEVERVAALRSYQILDTPPEAAYDEIAELAADVCQCPLAIIGMMDERRDWLKAKYGLPPSLTEVPREISMCATTVCGSDVLIVPDLRADERFAQFPSVAGPVTSESSSGWAADQRGKYLGVNNGDDRAGRR